MGKHKHVKIRRKIVMRIEVSGSCNVWGAYLFETVFLFLPPKIGCRFYQEEIKINSENSMCLYTSLVSSMFPVYFKKKNSGEVIIVVTFSKVS